MEKEFIPYELALELKELEFDEPCFGYWSNWAVQEPFLLTCELGKEIESSSINRKNILFKAPTFSQAFRFFREKYKLQSQPHYVGGDWKHYDIITHNLETGEEIEDSPMILKTYEEAELECLKELIEIVKEK